MLQRGLRSSPPRSIPGNTDFISLYLPPLIEFVLGSPIHQKLMSEQSLRHPVSESTSPIHQVYSLQSDMTMQDLQKYTMARDPTLGLPPENYNYAYDVTNRSSNYSYDSLNRSPLHTSPYATNPNSNLNSPINQMYGPMLGLGMYSGANSPILNPLLSPNTSPVFGGYGQTTPGTSISSITQGE